MRNSEKATILIDRYLRGEVTEGQKIEFYELLALGGSFKEEYELKQSIKDHFIVESHRNKLQLLKEIERKEFIDSNLTIQSNRRRRRVFAIVSVAAAIALLISVFNPMSTIQTSNEFILENFEAYPSSTIKRGTQTDEDAIKTDAFVLYELGKYDKAAPLLEEIAKQGDAEAYLYAGIAYLGIEHYSKSIELLKKYKSSITSHQEVPNLYIAINKQMMGQSTESIEELKALSSRSDFIGTQAKKYLKEFQK